MEKKCILMYNLNIKLLYLKLKMDVNYGRSNKCKISIKNIFTDSV